jgi:endonuclease/exonuclease/phosphatase family metal-dependent hydrolase
VGIARDLNKGEEIGIFFLIHKFFLIDSGYVWFNETRRPGQPGFGAGFPRMLTYAIVEDQQLHDKSLVINTHLDRESFESQKASVEIILETVNNVIAEDNKYRKKQIENIYVMGDFNIADNNSIFDILYDSKYKFVSARQVADTYDAGVNTFHDFQGENYELTSIIDHILFSSTKIVSKFEVLKSEPPYVSDHYPVVANFFNP